MKRTIIVFLIFAAGVTGASFAGNNSTGYAPNSFITGNGDYNTMDNGDGNPETNSTNSSNSY